jgi:hypothetical protein
MKLKRQTTHFGPSSHIHLPEVLRGLKVDEVMEVCQSVTGPKSSDSRSVSGRAPQLMETNFPRRPELQYDGDGGVVGFELAEEVDAGAVGEHEIAEDDVGRVPGEGGAAVADGSGGLDVPAVFFEDDGEEVTERRFVVDDEEVHGGRLSPLPIDDQLGFSAFATPSRPKA